MFTMCEELIMAKLPTQQEIYERVIRHVDNKTTDVGDGIWREPVENYQSIERFQAELKMMRRIPLPFCPSAALPEAGSYIARVAAGTPLLVVRGDDGVVRAFRNACRHRGMALKEGSGCAKSFVCPYHAWTYSLDGALKHIPGFEGFPSVDKASHGLVAVTAEEKSGIVFVTQEKPISDGALECLPEIIKPEQKVFNSLEFVDEANWKLIGETSMEGYHIRALHNKSFYPYGYDNLNIIELYKRNALIVFPFNRIERLREKLPEDRNYAGRFTQVFQIFPHAHTSVLSNHTLFIILEPLTPTSTRWVVYQLTNEGEEATEENLEIARRDANFVQDTGLLEDRAAAKSIQDGIPSEANEYFTFGQYEQVICNFHRSLDELIAKTN